MHKTLIGLRTESAFGVEQFLEGRDYQKLVEDEVAYFKFEADENNNTEIASYLSLCVGEENYGFVRLGKRIDDIEVSGNLAKFGMVVQRTAEIL